MSLTAINADVEDPKDEDAATSKWISDSFTAVMIAAQLGQFIQVPYKLRAVNLNHMSQIKTLIQIQKLDRNRCKLTASVKYGRRLVIWKLWLPGGRSSPRKVQAGV